MIFLVNQKELFSLYRGFRLRSIEMQLRKLEMVLAGGADVTFEDKYGENVLHHFTLHRVIPIEEEEEGEEEDWEIKQLNFTEILSSEIAEEKKEEDVILKMLQMIIDQGIDLGKEYNDGMSSTVLRLAVKNLQSRRVELFLYNGANINETRNDKTFFTSY